MPSRIPVPSTVQKNPSHPKRKSTSSSANSRKNRPHTAGNPSTNVKYSFYNPITGRRTEENTNTAARTKRQPGTASANINSFKPANTQTTTTTPSGTIKSFDTAYKQFPQHSTSDRIVLNFKSIGPDLRHSSKKSLSRQLRSSVRTLCISQNALESVRGIAFFENLESLSLAHNRLKSMKDLEQHIPEAVRHKQLRHLILRGNELCQHPDYKHEIIRLFPVLETLDQEKITPQERTMALSASRKLFYIYLKLMHVIEEYHMQLYQENLHLHVKLELYRRAYGTHRVFSRFDLPIQEEKRIMNRYRKGWRLKVTSSGTEWVKSMEILREDDGTTRKRLFEDTGLSSEESKKRNRSLSVSQTNDGAVNDAGANSAQHLGYSSQQQHQGSSDCTIPQLLQLIDQVAHPNRIDSILKAWKADEPFSKEECQFGDRLMLLVLHLYDNQYPTALDIEQVRQLRQDIEANTSHSSTQATSFQVFSSNSRFLRILKMLLLKKATLIHDVMNERSQVLSTNLFALTIPGVVGGSSRAYGKNTEEDEDDSSENSSSLSSGDPWKTINDGLTPLEQQEQQRIAHLNDSVAALRLLLDRLKAQRIQPSTHTSRRRQTSSRSSILKQSKRTNKPNHNTSLVQSSTLLRERASRRTKLSSSKNERHTSAGQPSNSRVTHHISAPRNRASQASLIPGSKNTEPTNHHEAHVSTSTQPLHKTAGINTRRSQTSIRKKASKIRSIIQSHREKLNQFDSTLRQDTRTAAQESLQDELPEVESIEGEEVEGIIFDGHPDQDFEHHPGNGESSRKRGKQIAQKQFDDEEEALRKWNQLLIDRRTAKQLDALAQAHLESQLLRKAFYSLRGITQERRKMRIVFLSWQVYAHKRQCYRKAVHRIRYARKLYWVRKCFESWRESTRDNQAKKAFVHREKQLQRYQEKQQMRRHRSTSRGKERILKGDIPLKEKSGSHHVRNQCSYKKRKAIDTRMIRLELARSLQENIRSQQKILKTLSENLP